MGNNCLEGRNIHVFLIADLLSYGLGEALTLLKNKKKEKRILDELNYNISSFDLNFDNTEIDTHTFDKFMTESPMVSSYFSKIFLSGQDQNNDILEKIIDNLIDKINAKRASQGISSFGNRELVKKYFDQLVQYLKKERQRILGIESQLLIAEIKDSLLPVVSSILSEQLDKPTNENFKFTSQLLYDKNQDSILSLGERYSPEINITTVGNMPFETLCKTIKLKKSLTTSYNGVIDQYNECKSHIDEFSEKFSYITIDNNFDIHKIKNNADKITSVCEIIREKSLKSSALQKYNYFKLIESLNNLEDLIADSKISLWDKPFLIVTGDAAIGKSHLLAENVERMQKLGHPVIFLLGQQFLSSNNPLRQIVESFGYSISVEEFLYQFNKFSEEKGKRGLLIIDALNESDSNHFWKTQLQSITSQIAKYPNIGIVFSIRSTYISNILPENYIEKNEFQIYNHNGITSAEDHEVEKIEDYYGLNKGELLKIYPEFSSPLFLKLAAISSLPTASAQKKMTWERLINQYIISVEKEISSENRLNYNGTYLDSIIQTISKMMLDKHSNFLNYREVKKKIAEELEYHMESNRRYLDELIINNLFSKFTDFNGEEKIHFTYEKIRDFFIADNIIQNFAKDRDILEKAVQEFLLLNNEYGVIEILFFLLPNKLNVEITDLIPENKQFDRLERAFIGSLPWRTVFLNTESTKDILNNILNDDNLARDFFNSQSLLSIDPESPFNAEWLTKILLPLNNDLRDYVWTSRISNGYSSFSLQMIQRIKRSYAYQSDNQLRLSLQQLTWILSSVNAILRDSATKIISLILIKSPNLISELIETFKDISDLYIRERLYAAVFGAIVKVDDSKVIEATANLVYEVVFNQNEVIPHVILRDYARQIVEFAINKDLCSHIDRRKIAPPYNSLWYDFEFSNEDVDAYERKYKEISKDAGNSVRSIRSSMITKDGRGTGSYGDFGRYVLGNKISPWANQFEDQALSNIAFKRIFEIGFNPNIHANFDRYMSSNYDRHNHKIERIGKKYQWIALYELIAKLADNFQIYEEKIIYDEVYNKYQKRILEEFINLFDKIGSGQKNDLRKEDHIIEKRKENIRYFQGPFENSLRKIDPTHHAEIPNVNKNLIKYLQPSSLTEPNVFDHDKEFIECEYNNKKYLNLFFRYDYENKEEEKQTNVAGVAFFSKKENRSKVIEDKEKNYIGGVTAPSSTNIFLHEFFWGSAFEHFKNLDYEESNIEEYAVYEYNWEPSNDYSLNDYVSLYIPSKVLVDYFSLQSVNDGIWKNESGEIIAFDGSVLGYERSLWFDREKILQYMKETDQSLFWKSWGREAVNAELIEKWFLIEKIEMGYEKYFFETFEGNARE